MVPRERKDSQRLTLDRRRSSAPGSLRLGVVVARESDCDPAESERPAAGLHREPRDAAGTARRFNPCLCRTQPVEKRWRRADLADSSAATTHLSPAAVSGGNAGSIAFAVISACVRSGFVVGDSRFPQCSCRNTFLTIMYVQESVKSNAPNRLLASSFGAGSFWAATMHADLSNPFMNRV